MNLCKTGVYVWIRVVEEGYLVPCGARVRRTESLALAIKIHRSVPLVGFTDYSSCLPLVIVAEYLDEVV